MRLVTLTPIPPPRPARVAASCVLLWAIGALGSLLAATATATATAPEMVFTRLGSTDGLSQEAIRSIVQDSQGFMWFGTEDGLNRFDGYELRHFIHSRSDPGSLPNNWIAALARTDSGKLMVGSDGGGLVWRDDMAGRFTPPGDGHGSLLDPNSRIRALHQDRGGGLWVATRNAGLYWLDPTLLHKKEYRHDLRQAASISDDSVYAIAEDGSGRVWIGTASGLDRLEPQTGRIESFTARLNAAVGRQESSIKVDALYVDTRGTLWIGLDTGLVKLDDSSGILSRLPQQDVDGNRSLKGAVTAMLEDDARRFWVGTSEGLALLDRRTDRIQLVTHDATNPSSLPDNYITSLYQDKTGLLWVGTKTGGVARWNPRSWSFGHHRFGGQGVDNITSFAVDGRGVLWIGSFGEGARSIDPLTGVITHYDHSRSSPLPLGDDNVMCLVTDERNRVWIGTMGDGIVRMDPSRHSIAHFHHDPTDVTSLPASGIMSLLNDSRGRIWVGTYGGGLAMIDPKSDRVQRYEHNADAGAGLSADRATALAEDRGGLIWIGTDGGGLNILDPKTGRFTHFVHDPHDSRSLGADTVYALHLDDSGTMWVGTRSGGLDRVRGTPFGGEPLRFDNFSEAEGLPNSTVYGIESDHTGKLWISTNRGLASLQPTDNGVRSFHANHGLQGEEFNFGAHFRGPDGTLYFGGTNGYNAFLPERLQLNDTPPAVVLTGVMKLNSRATATPETLRSLDLGFHDAMVTFQFAALDFAGPAENRYAYRLEGFDRDWIDAGNTRQATYTHLDGGNYVFRVRASNNDGQWTENPLALPIRVSRAPWTTWWARASYAAVIFAVLYLVWRGQHRKILQEVAYASRLKQEVDARTAELAERNRDMEAANRRLREVSVSDSLTGLGNRRRLHDAMAALLNTPQGHATTESLPQFVLMVVDLDFLKPINDQYGHEGGDALLVQFAGILRSEFRADDLIVRWGGDEFVVLCSHADLEMASALAERVRSSVAKQIFRVGDGAVARTSCSIGFATVPFIPGRSQLIDWQQSLSIADLALYHAKRDRNTWIGWAGTEKAAELPSLQEALAAGPGELELGGYLVVRRRPWNPEETVDRLRTLSPPSAR